VRGGINVVDGPERNSVLIIDDEKTNVMALTHILNTEYTVYAVMDGLDGVRIAEDYCPDVILLDIVMPDMDGYEVLAALKYSEKAKHIPVIFITGLNNPADEEKGLSLGASDYISKPFSPSIVRLRVRNQINLINQTRLATEKEIAEKGSRAKSNFLSHMSHEIRTPLNAIIGMIKIGISTEDADKKNYCLKRAESASKHLLGIINDILDMSKIESDIFELSSNEIDFEEMLMEIANVANVRAEEKKQVFIVNLSKDVPARIESDELHLSQVLTNLLSNAIKFTPEKGMVVLSVDKAEETGDDIELRIEITDTGIGMTEEQQARLFRPFIQADASITKKFGGTGLGLVICKKIIELMGGNIRIDSELDKGSKFTFTIKAKKLSEKPRADLHAGINADELRILAVDNSIDIREFFINTMEGLRLSCDIAANGAEALEMIRRADVPYNIFFIDWQLSDINGVELTKRIKDIYAENSVIIMSSMADWHVIEKEAVAAGVNCSIPKPLFPSGLINAINTCMGESYKAAPHHEHKELIRKIYDFSSHTVLIAEDIEINREIMSAILSETDITIDFAETGKTAVSMFRENPDKYSLILMDINMPEMDGYEAARQIRALDIEKAKTIPILAMTANVFREDIERCLSSGMNDHTGKPIDASALFGMINKYITHPGENIRMRNVHELEQGIAWDEELMTGNPLVDMQHQRIFERVSDLVVLCEDGSDVEKLQDTLEYLVNYTIRHFADEEALQLKYGYPDYEYHRKLHEDLKASVIGDLMRKYEESGSSAELSSDVNKIIVRGLANHIKHEDKKMSAHIRAVNAAMMDV